MRKLTAILLLCFVCLLCGTGTTPALASGSQNPASATVASTATNQWDCERQYNSDLSLPQAVSEIVPVTVSIPSPLRGGRCIQRAGAKCGIACGLYGSSMRTNLTFETPNLSSAATAVDYYVYRLRRLII